MDIDSLLQTMTDLDLLALGEDPRNDDPLSGMTVHQIDWGQVEAPMNVEMIDTGAPAGGLQVLVDRLERDAESWQARTPPPQIFDAWAWYLPIHYRGDEYGIYITEDAVAFLAAGLWERMPFDRRYDPDVVFGVFRVLAAGDMEVPGAGAARGNGLRHGDVCPHVVPRCSRGRPERAPDAAK